MCTGFTKAVCERRRWGTGISCPRQLDTPCTRGRRSLRCVPSRGRRRRREQPAAGACQVAATRLATRDPGVSSSASPQEAHRGTRSPVQFQAFRKKSFWRRNTTQTRRKDPIVGPVSPRAECRVLGGRHRVEEGSGGSRVGATVYPVGPTHGTKDADFQAGEQMVGIWVARQADFCRRTRRTWRIVAFGARDRGSARASAGRPFIAAV